MKLNRLKTLDRFWMNGVRWVTMGGNWLGRITVIEYNNQSLSPVLLEEQADVEHEQDIRPFTKQDWCGLAGATPFTGEGGESPPWIGYLRVDEEFYQFCGDANGVQLLWVDIKAETMDDRFWSYHVALPSYLCYAMMQGMLLDKEPWTSERLRAIGFLYNE